jgi:hypothetical protein
MVKELCGDSRVWDTVEMLEQALLDIVAYDSFRDGPIAPRSTPTENAMREIAFRALGRP